MAQFIPFDLNVKVNGQSILAVVNAIPTGQEARKAILENHGLVNLQPEGWYSQQSYLKGFEEIARETGPNTLFAIGKAVPENAIFPPGIDTLEKAFTAIDHGYKMNHKGGEIGYYKLVSFDTKKREAVMVCKTPYPSEFDRGIITTMLRRFKPKDSLKYDVVLNTLLPTRLKGDDSCTYTIFW